MMYIKLNKKQLVNKVVKLTKEKTDLIEANNLKGETLENLQDKYDDMVKVKESIQLQNQTLEKRFLPKSMNCREIIDGLYEVKGYDYMTTSKVNKRMREKTYTGKYLDLKNAFR